MERTAGAMMVRYDFRELRGEVNAKLDNCAWREPWLGEG
jgi:hypothetical protein